MNDFDTPQNELERAIAAAAEAGEDADGSARRAVLVALATNNVAVILPPTDAEGNPPENAQPLFVSDGQDLEQPMLAAFTRIERALAFEDTFEDAAQPGEIAGTQLILGTPEGCGIRLNPNQELGFRIGPELANAIRKDVMADMERLSAGAPDAPQ